MDVTQQSPYGRYPPEPQCSSVRHCWCDLVLQVGNCSLHLLRCTTRQDANWWQLEQFLNSVCVADLKPRTCGEVEVECVEVWRWLVARAKRDMMRHVYRGGCDGWWKWRSLEMGQWPFPLCGVGVHQKFARSPGRISHHKIWVGSEAGLTVFLLTGVRQLAWYHQQFSWWKCNFNGSDEAVVLHSSPFIRKLCLICILQLCSSGG